jgi:hypothetical protein
MSCPCDKLIHPPGLVIPAGLDIIPRQIASFPEFRRAMLAAIRSQDALTNWRARGEDDLGIMLLEMWAYVCDALAFYDEVIAHEAYLRTARLRPSLRRLVDLLGYVPGPAVAASVKLALFAEGRQPVKIPAGTAFRSGSFDSERPQVFEAQSDVTIHPLTNEWTVEPARPETIGVDNPSYLLLDPGTAKLKAEDIVLVRDTDGDAQTQVRTVSNVATIDGADGGQYVQVDFDNSLSLTSDTKLDNIKLLTPSQTASLWTMTSWPAINSSGNPVYYSPRDTSPGEAFMEQAYTANTKLTLDGLYRQIKPGMFIIVAKGEEYRWFKVNSVTESMIEIIEADADTGTPAVTVPVTRLVLDTTLNNATRRDTACRVWTNDDRAEIIVYYSFSDGGTVTAEAGARLEPNGNLKLMGPIETPEDEQDPSRFFLEDKNESGVEVEGQLDFAEEELNLDSGTTWDPSLVHPVQVYGNVVSATRGETVSGEVLGSGDASAANQSFTLKKKPLTYVSSPTADNESGVASTLEIYVNGIRWEEVSSFFGVGSDQEVYIVRQNDDGEAIITFGDGQRGARLPSGTGNVVANYRYGAGAASPPAGSITQIAKPVKGLQSVKNPVAASGGDDAEMSENIRTYAPDSALILGRAVSIKDMEAVAAGVAGVRAVRAEWRWHSTRQRPVVQIWYIGEEGIEKNISQTLHGLSDPTVPIDVKRADGEPVKLSIDVEIDPGYVEDDVLADVRDALMNEETGLLAPERIGIGQPLFRSQIFWKILEIPGTEGILGIQWNDQFLDSFAVKPEAGEYFDLEEGTLLLNGKDEGDAQ